MQKRPISIEEYVRRRKEAKEEEEKKVPEKEEKSPAWMLAVLYG